VIQAPATGSVRAVWVQAGEAVLESHALVNFVADERATEQQAETAAPDPALIRTDLQEVIDRHGYGLDQNRPQAVAKRRATGQRTARENIDDLCDEGTFVEYGPLVIAAQRRRRSLQELMEKTPGDGMVTGLAQVNGAQFGASASQCVVMTYDYTVMAGTQGIQNHHKKDRMFEVAERLQVPVVLFSEGGGGRPGDTDGLGSSASLDCMAFLYFARLSGLVPLVGIASGRSFAGNAALLGCCDVVIATRNANIGMGGPAMIEGGGLGVFKPEQVGPASVQATNGVIDILVEDEAQAVRTAQQYLSYFQGAVTQWEAADQRELRHLIPENRRRVYDVRKVLEGLFDSGSVLELRAGFGKGMITAFARVEGRPVGVIANNPQHLAGAIDANGADKASRFMQLCDAFDIPIVFLCDTPGIMVGPQAEETALVRHAARMFVTAASLTVPFFTIILRKAYGLGAMTMAGGTMKAPLFTVSWPTGEFGAMGLDGAVRLGFRKELEAQKDEKARNALFERMVAEMVERGKAVNTATFFEFDDVIDPMDSRRWIVTGLNAAGITPENRAARGKKRPCVDTW
ncbi:MAG: carboxyl transferase domain-containing protein, partial [Ketobacter sp.]